MLVDFTNVAPVGFFSSLASDLDFAVVLVARNTTKFLPFLPSHLNITSFSTTKIFPTTLVYLTSFSHLRHWKHRMHFQILMDLLAFLQFKDECIIACVQITPILLCAGFYTMVSCKTYHIRHGRHYSHPRG